MLKPVRGDVLNNPQIVQHTNNILAFKREEAKEKKRALKNLTRIAVKIGNELITTKEDLDNSGDKTAWQRWLKKHVRFSKITAERYMRVSRLVKKSITGDAFFDVKLSCLYHVVAMPDEILEKLTPDTSLFDPKTKEQKPLKEMSKNALKRALNYLEHGENQGRTPESMQKRLPAIADELEDISKLHGEIPADWDKFWSRVGPLSPIYTQTPKGAGTIEIKAKSKEEFALRATEILDYLAKKFAEIHRLDGKLKGTTKGKALNKYEGVRLVILDWPAWAKKELAATLAKRRK